VDLQEIVDPQSKRHPWEKSRVKFIQKALKEYAPASFSILDVGCGDGYVADQLAKTLSPSEYIGFDVNLSASQIESYSKRNSQVTFINNSEKIAGKKFDLVLLLDVLEHIDDDASALKEIVSEHLSNKSKMLITVPAFQRLYGYHDSILGHRRRYNQNRLKDIVRGAGCKISAKGYMFASLLPVRALSFLLQRVSFKQKPGYSGVGNWNGSLLVSDCIEHALTIDNQILFLFSKSGLLIPGLTIWALCEKQQ
jgi:SAM-dependent methyltransferase